MAVWAAPLTGTLSIILTRSDAGTPGLCDPGSALVAACVQEGISVYPVPGASALAALLSVAGFSEAGFTFHGFFPRENRDRAAWAEKALGAGGLHLFYESPHRVRSTLTFLAERFPEAPLVVGRELTKRFETLSRGLCSELERKLGKEEPRGEYALALLLPPALEPKAGLQEEEIRALVKELAELGASRKVIQRTAMSHGLRKNEAYKLSLECLEKTQEKP